MNFTIHNKSFLLLFILFLLLPVSAVMAAEKMPAFSLPSAVDNKKVSSKSFTNKVLLVTFFATWCPPCREEIPTLKKLQKQLGDKGFSVLAFSVDEGGKEIVKTLMSQEHINYPVLMANKALMKGFGGISGIPTSFLVSRKGEILRTYAGYIPYKLLKKHIDNEMKKKAKK